MKKKHLLFFNYKIHKIINIIIIIEIIFHRHTITTQEKQPKNNIIYSK
jgi:hypothetical protein